MSTGSSYTNKLHVESKETEILRLKARIYDCQSENEGLRRQLEEARAELKETQALLGQTFVSATLGKRKAIAVDEGPVILPVPEHIVKVENEPERVAKRERSPSIEIIEAPISFRGKPIGQKNTKIVQKVEPTVAEPNQLSTRLIQPPPPPPPPPSSLPPADIAGHSSSPGAVVNEEDMGRLRKRPKLEPVEELDIKPSGTDIILADRVSLERASVEAGAVVTLIDIKAVQDSPVKPEKQEADEIESTPISPEEDFAEVVAETDIPIATSSSLNATVSETKRKPQKSSKTALTLSASVAEAYLGSTAPLVINPPPLTLEVPRTFLRVAYGGSDQQFLQYIPAERNPSGPVRRRLVFPTLALNPLMPSSPGMQGLVFASRREILNNGSWTVFCKRSTASPAVWLYVGEYVNTLAGTMKAEEFRQQTPLVQREWATQLMDCKKHDVYVSMRARIALRKAGKLPVKDKAGAERETEETQLVDSEILAVKGARGHPVSKEDIVEAFCKGEEAIDVVRMQCVEYDHVFAEAIRTSFPAYPALLKVDKGEKNTARVVGAGKGKIKAGVTTAGSGKKAFVKDEDVSHSDDEDDIRSSSGDDFECSQLGMRTFLRQYGTRSRRRHT